MRNKFLDRKKKWGTFLLSHRLRRRITANQIFLSSNRKKEFIFSILDRKHFWKTMETLQLKCCFDNRISRGNQDRYGVKYYSARHVTAQPDSALQTNEIRQIYSRRFLFTFFSRGHATLELAVSVGPSVPYFFWLRMVFALGPLPNRPQRSYRVSGRVSGEKEKRILYYLAKKYIDKIQYSSIFYQLMHITI